MDDLDKIESELVEVQSGLKGFLVRDWAYIAMLFFALLGVALTTVERELMGFYWFILVPVFGFICVIESWRRLKNPDQRLMLVKVQVLHWLSVIFAMLLVFTGDMRNALSNEIAALILLILLSLGLGVQGSPIFQDARWLWFTVFIGVNLFQSGLTRWCLMEDILRKLGVRESHA